MAPAIRLALGGIAAAFALLGARDASAQTPEHTARVVTESLTQGDAPTFSPMVRTSLDGPGARSPALHAARIFRASLDDSPPGAPFIRVVRVDLDRGTTAPLPALRAGKPPHRAIRTEI